MASRICIKFMMEIEIVTIGKSRLKSDFLHNDSSFRARIGSYNNTTIANNSNSGELVAELTQIAAIPESIPASMFVISRR